MDSELPPPLPDAPRPVPASAPLPRPFGALYAFFIFAGYVGIQFALGIIVAIPVAIFYAVKYGEKSTEIELMWSATILGGAVSIVVGGVLTLLLVRMIVSKGGALEPLRQFGWQPAPARSIRWAAIAGLAIGTLYSLLITLFPESDRPQGVVEGAISNGGWRMYLWVVMAIFLAPPIEEFIFRGVMLRGMSQSWGPVPAALVVTGLFLALHIPESWRSPQALLAIATLGAAALIARVKTGSLVPAIALHVSYNGVISVLVLGSTI